MYRGPEIGIPFEHVGEQRSQRWAQRRRRRSRLPAPDGLQQSVHIVALERVPARRHVVSVVNMNWCNICQIVIHI